jgi:hypothetical protein
MKLTRSLVSFSLVYTLVFLSILPLSVAAQDSKVALQRGYRTGYSDGYMAGYRDVIDGASKSAQQHPEYSKADRAYNQSYGTIADYQDGYRQGFETGYETGYAKNTFDATIPVNIAFRGAAPTEPAAQVPTETPATTEPVQQPAASEPQPAAPVNSEAPATNSAPETNVAPATAEPAAAPSDAAGEAPKTGVQKVAYVAGDDPVIIIPKDIELILELDEALDTERNREGDKFTAKIISPVELAGARVEGHIDKVTKPGRLKRRSELLLSFDRLVVSERRWTNFDAILTEVMPVKGDNVKTVDGEGTAIGKGSLKSDAIKVGAATGTGATVGVIAGGPVGAAVGAGVGAAFGVGAVVIEKGKHIKLNQAQQLRIKTSYETQIR